jgi:hypothetical protein
MAEAARNSNFKNSKMARGSHLARLRMVPRCLGLEYYLGQSK